ncbi:MAG TPA: protein-disulfide reductase DsbD domain-containing protein, partial [Bacteroidota bacterium]|nr:protein-disulfide reductase DsbD domain-containing protein [Bacteroidota bacterium]
MTHMRTFPSVILFFVLGSFSTSWTSGQESSQLPRSSAHNVRIEHRLSVKKVAKGATFQVAVVLDIAGGWHINSHRPTSEYLIPTNLELASKEGMIITDIRYPKGQLEKLGFSDQPLDVYQGSVTIFVSVRVSEKFADAGDTLRGKLRVQACDDKMCLAPSAIDIAIPVSFGEPTESVESVNEDVFLAYKTEDFQT